MSLLATTHRKTAAKNGPPIATVAHLESTYLEEEGSKLFHGGALHCVGGIVAAAAGSRWTHVDQLCVLWVYHRLSTAQQEQGV